MARIYFKCGNNDNLLFQQISSIIRAGRKYEDYMRTSMGDFKRAWESRK